MKAGSPDLCLEIAKDCQRFPLSSTLGHSLVGGNLSVFPSYIFIRTSFDALTYLENTNIIQTLLTL